MLTSWSEQLTPATLSIASVLIRPAGERVLDPAALGERRGCRLHRPPGSAARAVEPDGVVGLVAGVGVRLGRRLDVGADAAVPEQVDGRAQDLSDQVGRRQLVGVDPERLLDLLGDPDRLRASAGRRLRPRRSAAAS